MRIFLAGASGVIGMRLVELLTVEGHTVAAMTRSAQKVDGLAALGAEPVLCDVFDADALRGAVVGFAPDAVLHQLTDLPDDVAEIPAYAARNDRIRGEGTANLLAAAAASGTRRLLAQSIAWTPPRGVQAVAAHERQVLEAGGVVIRYGQFYGPGTYYEDGTPPPPRIHVHRAASETLPLLDAAPGVVLIAEDESNATVARRLSS